MPAWDEIRQFVSEFGLVKGIFTIFFFMAHAWIYRLYSGRLEDRQKEIDRLAADNHEYRERFLSTLDREMGYRTPTRQVTSGSEDAKKRKKGDR